MNFFNSLDHFSSETTPTLNCWMLSRGSYMQRVNLKSELFYFREQQYYTVQFLTVVLCLSGIVLSAGQSSSVSDTFVSLPKVGAFRRQYEACKGIKTMYLKFKSK